MRKGLVLGAIGLLTACGSGPKHAEGGAASPPLTPTIGACAISEKGAVIATIQLENKSKDPLYLGEGEAEPTNMGEAWTHEYTIAWTSPDFMFGASSSGTFLKQPPPKVTPMAPGAKVQRVLPLTEDGTLGQGDVQVGLFWHDGSSDDPAELNLRKACLLVTIESAATSCKVTASEACTPD